MIPRQAAKGNILQYLLGITQEAWRLNPPTEIFEKIDPNSSP
jgi:hypothetical protein